ncbi:Crp/Fnr family transcriptional regulator [Chryseobacterium sp. SNU WT5]|uniref:Crp/Fnr family transcriptional regulator n=1 Tax=Chryseobacterium sp. SNU WT5 TaxID=2594269 RepID=UPI001E5D94B7|nr:Crp/Fnr family transcriptional regulator [Chryseobacterium sp. SNU WT5]
MKRNIDLFDNLTDTEYLELKKIFCHKKYKKGEFILKENDTVQDVYFISSGLLKLSYFNNETREFILSFAFENWWETDFSAFLHQTKATLNLQCVEDTEVFSLSYSNYNNILKKYDLYNYFLQKSIRGHIANQRRILSLIALSPKERYEQFILLYPTLFQRIPKSVLALYLGVSRETLSRLYKQTKK